jgi:DNA-binding NarL/FixJ family response regulator
MKNVIIADDHRLVANGIAGLIDGIEGIKVLAIANTLEESADLISLHRPDILLLDVAMPDGDGIDAIKEFVSLCPTLRIIVLTTYAEPSVIQRAKENGAHGYILKNSSTEELIEGICAVAGGEFFICKESRNLMIGQSEAPPELTIREREILRLIVEGNTMKQIADKLHLGFETVHSYTKYIRQKLGCNNTASLVRIAMERHLI